MGSSPTADIAFNHGRWLLAWGCVPCSHLPIDARAQSLFEHGVTRRAASRAMLGVATGLLHAAPTQPPTTAERMPKASAMMTEPMHPMEQSWRLTLSLVSLPEWLRGWT